MSNGTCHQKNKERGTWFQIKCVQDDIVAKEAKGKDATFERELLKSWAKYPGWENEELVE